uniref:Speedy/RINGO cell cycle regulator family member E4 n=1 Tax=Macaca nemestrina TaxID=9545 RepID=A0A2K6DGF4_MACNE
MQKHYTLVWFLYSALGVDPSPSCRSLCWKRKREWLDQSDEEPEKELSPEPEETWVVETLCGLKMKLKRRRVSLVLPEHHEAFNRLPWGNPSPHVWSLCWEKERGGPEKELSLNPEETLRWRRRSLPPDLIPLSTIFLFQDVTLPSLCPFSPSYLLHYFSRGRPLSASWQYQRIHFFLALYLANDMEEDSETPKQNIIYFLYRKNRSQIPSFHKRRFQFFYSMAWVSLEELEEIQAYDPEHWVWARDRA